MNEKPKILIVIEGGVPEIICGTQEIEVSIHDNDAESFTKTDCDVVSEEMFLANVNEHFPDCAQCGKPMVEGQSAESTFCGSMHTSCMAEHAKQCPTCAKDFSERNE